MSNNFNNQDFDVRTLSDFQTWSDAALRCYLSLRKRKLLVDGYVIPDPFGIRGGWLEESDSSRASWPAIFISLLILLNTWKPTVLLIWSTGCAVQWIQNWKGLQVTMIKFT